MAESNFQQLHMNITSKRSISLTAEPIWLSITMELHNNQEQVLNYFGRDTSTLLRNIATLYTKKKLKENGHFTHPTPHHLLSRYPKGL